MGQDKRLSIDLRIVGQGRYGVDGGGYHGLKEEASTIAETITQEGK